MGGGGGKRRVPRQSARKLVYNIINGDNLVTGLTGIEPSPSNGADKFTSWPVDYSDEAGFLANDKLCSQIT